MKKECFFKVMLIALGLFYLNSIATAQTDVTNTYLINTDFETDITFTLADGTTTQTPYATSGLGQSAFIPSGWTAALSYTASESNAKYVRMATVAYGLTFTTQPDPVNGTNPPSTDKDGNDGAGLTLSGAFGTVSTITQEVTLPPGQYELKFDAIDLNGGKTIQTNYFGFEPVSGTPVYGTEKSFAATWTTYSVVFMVTEATTGKIRIGVGGVNAGSGSQAKLYIDNIKLFFTDLFSQIDPLKVTLTTLKESADIPSNYDLSVVNALLATEPTSENVAKLTTDLQAAIAILRAVIASNLDATLSTIKVDGSKIKGFKENIFAYNHYLAVNSTNVPVVSATTNSEYATVSDIKQASSIPGTATITVTPGKGETQTYTVSFMEDYLYGWYPHDYTLTPDAVGWRLPEGVTAEWKNGDMNTDGYRQLGTPVTDTVLYITKENMKYSFPIHVQGKKFYELTSNIYRRNGEGGKSANFYFNISSSRENSGIYSEHTVKIDDTNSMASTTGRLLVSALVNIESVSYFMVSANGAGWQNAGFWNMHLSELGDALSVTFDVGEDIDIPVQYLLAGADEIVIKPADPERVGDVFEGWYSDSAHTTEYDFETPVSSDLVIYAKWKNLTSNVDLCDINDEIVSVKYYNLQGLEIDQPVKKDVYIVKQTFKSGAKKVFKQLIAIDK